MRSKTLAFSAVACAAASLTAFACSDGNDGRSEQNVTAIPQTPLTDQGQTGNCWLYATANWTESLRIAANGNAQHLSPAYWLYWRLYDQLVAGRAHVSFGGYWGEAAEIIQERGLMPMGAFVIDDVKTSLDAVRLVNRKIDAGVFGQAGDPGTPTVRVPAFVRAVLDEAFGLGNDSRALLTKVFGVDGKQTFRTGAAPAGALVRAQDFTVQSATRRGPIMTTLDRLLGDPSPDPQASRDVRIGEGAWSAAYPPFTEGLSSMMGRSTLPGGPIPGGEFEPLPRAPFDAASSPAGSSNPIEGLPPLTPPDKAAWRAFYKRIQTALHDGVPVPMAFSILDANIDYKAGRFHAGAPMVPKSGWGGHEVILTDYEVTNVPDYGTLAVGAPATGAQRKAALDDAATITFFRVKNSWGAHGFEGMPGYHDIDVGYLEQPIDLCDDSKDDPDAGVAIRTKDNCWAIAPQLWDVVLPPGY